MVLSFKPVALFGSLVSILIRTWIPLILSDFNEHEIDNCTSINIFCDYGTFWIIGSLNFSIWSGYVELSLKSFGSLVSILIRTWIPLILLDFNEHEIDNWTSIDIFCDYGTFWIKDSLNLKIWKKKSWSSSPIVGSYFHWGNRGLSL